MQQLNISQKENDLLPLLNTNLILPLELFQLAKQNNVKAFFNTDTFFNNPKYSYAYLPEYTLSKKHSLEWMLLNNNKNSLKLFNMKIFHMYGPNDSEKKFSLYYLADKKITRLL